MDVPVNHKENKCIVILSALKYENRSIHTKKEILIFQTDGIIYADSLRPGIG